MMFRPAVLGDVVTPNLSNVSATLKPEKPMPKLNFDALDTCSGTLSPSAPPDVFRPSPVTAVVGTGAQE